MSDEKPAAEQGAADQQSESRKNDLIEAAIGLAVLGLGAAVLNGGRGGIGGVARTIVNGPAGAQRTPPFVPAHLRGVDPSLWRNPPTV